MPPSAPGGGSRSWSPTRRPGRVTCLRPSRNVLGPDHPPVIAAAEADPALARLLRRRLLVHGVADHDLDVRTGTKLPDRPAAPDVIVTQVPYQPGEARDAEAVFEVVGDVAVRLSAGRFGVVLGPASALIDDLRAVLG